jgi:hypothetical protein
MSGASIQQMADRVAQLMEERLRLRGKGLQDKLRRGGRTVPKRLREAATVLSEAAALAQNPKMYGQVDYELVAAAYDSCLRQLGSVRAGERRTTAALNILASVAFSLLLLAALVAGLVYWRGLL